jgi:hypothetical protein
MRFLPPVLGLALASLFASLSFGQTAEPAASSTPAVPPPIAITLTPPAAAASAATTAPAPATAANPAVTASKPAVPPAIPPPDSVPDDVNPFADAHNLPKPLTTINMSCTPMNADMRIVQFDGNSMHRFYLEGPDFEWEFDPLDDWILAPKGIGESFAFVYSKNPQARLSFSLYGAKEFMPNISPASIVLYLAAVRENDPKGFILTTPIPKDTLTLPFIRFAFYGGQSVTYATTSPVLMLHDDWFADLNGEYQLVMKLTSPPALMSRLETQLRFIFNRGAARKGLGMVPPPAPGAAPAEDTAKPSDG